MKNSFIVLVPGHGRGDNHDGQKVTKVSDVVEVVSETLAGGSGHHDREEI